MQDFEKIKNRIIEIKNAIPKLKKSNREVAEFLWWAICDSSYCPVRRSSDWQKQAQRKEKLLQLLSKGKTQFNDVFSGTRKELIPLFFDKENAKLFEQLWERLTLYTYESGWGRRSFRSQKRSLLYLEKGVDLFATFFNAIERGCSMQTYFDFAVHPRTAAQRDANEKQPPEALAWQAAAFHYGIQLDSHWIAAAIDNGDSFVKQRISDIILGDNQQGVLSSSIVRGILMSRDTEMHKLLGNLLLAAKLQEGLRQTILEAIDECSLDGFRYMLNLVLENNLERFSSTVRAIGTWTGLNFADARPKTLQKTLELMVRMASNSNESDLSRLLQSDDLIELYIALWGVALHEIEDTKEPLLTLMDDGVKSGDRKYKRLAALYFLGQTKNEHLVKEIVLGALEETDLEIWFSILQRIREIFSVELTQRKLEFSLKFKPEDDGENENKDEDEDENECESTKKHDVVSDEIWKEPGDLTLEKNPTQMRLNDSEIRTIFERLKTLAESTPKKEMRFERYVYYDSIHYIAADSFISKMLDAVKLLGCENNDIEILHSLIPKMDSSTKSNFVQILSTKDPLQRKFILELYGEPHISRRGLAHRLKNADLTSEEYEKVEYVLRLKSADIRLEAIQLILARLPEGLQESIERLLNSKNEQKRLAGLDLIEQSEKLAKEKKEYEKVAAHGKELVLQLASESKKKGTKKTAAEEILVQKLATASASPVYTLENGYGLCDPAGKADVPEPKKSKTLLADLFTKNVSRFEKLLKALDELIHENKDYEYSGYHEYSDEEQYHILGADCGFIYITSREERNKRFEENNNRQNYILIDDFPLADVWKKFAKSQKLTSQDLFLITMIKDLSDCIESRWNTSFDQFCNGKGEYKKFAHFFVDWFKTTCWPYEKMLNLCRMFEQGTFDKKRKVLRYPEHISGLLIGYWNTVPEKDKADLLIDILSGLYHATPKNLFTQPCCTVSQEYNYSGIKLANATIFEDGNPLLSELFSTCNCINKEIRFQDRFQILYKFYEESGFVESLSPHTDWIEKAREFNLIDDAELYRELLVRADRCSHLATLTGGHTHRYYVRKFGNKKEIEYPNFERILPNVVDRILEIEIKRGDSETEVTKMVQALGKIEGIRHFSDILKAMDKTPFIRGYSYSNAGSRADIFCSLLQVCVPEANPNLKFLDGISEKRLLEAAMYVPEWIDPIQKYLDWNGLTSACWYFHAHINESMSETKESIIARYSPISPQRFKDGAFDIDWFNDAYQTLGEKRFQIVYDAAKYITSGSNHRRAQIFADAVRGKLKLEDVQKSVVEKRNKDNVLAYSLLPLKKGKAGEKEQLERYAFLQNFLNESKKFGQQRKESERKIVEIALENLARAAGFADVNRFIWAMETEKSKELAKYFEPKIIDGFQLSIEIDEFGKATIRSCKEDGTILKDVPTKLKKHEYVAELKEIVKTFKTQFSTVRANFEKAMELETDFTAAELSNLSNNPVIRPIIEKLIYRFEKSFGFFKDGQLTCVNGRNETKKLKPMDSLIIAHPFHLYDNKVWKAFQKIVFEQEIVQPFKQVFRELYLPNADEKKSKTCSMRYAGHQIQPSKTVALLRNRSWTIDPDFGFQKVFYKIDVLVHLYSYADWFTPAEMEPPTLEKIEFLDRKTLDVIPLSKIPPVVFSEIMRDLDLVVSVAHVGGVDPEASLSTVEMRSVILEETLRLLKLKNVTIRKSHAQIKGTLGEYTVHLGSGLVQIMAGGSLTILPVHSQKRGRLFLPFVDDDPKTAEILSKTILLAEDDKLKDPTILNAIENK